MSLPHKAHNLSAGKNAAGGSLGSLGPLGPVGPLGENVPPSEEVGRGWVKVARGFVDALHSGGEARYQRALDVVCEVRKMSSLRFYKAFYVCIKVSAGV